MPRSAAGRTDPTPQLEARSGSDPTAIFPAAANPPAALPGAPVFAPDTPLDPHQRGHEAPLAGAPLHALAPVRPGAAFRSPAALVDAQAYLEPAGHLGL
jgi:hypothetical protein